MSKSKKGAGAAGENLPATTSPDTASDTPIPEKGRWISRLLTSILPKRFRDPPPVVAVVRLSGSIAATGSSFRSSLSLASTASTLKKAFSLRGAKAVAIVINSPGGSPVQSTLIFKRIRALAEEKGLPVTVFCEDVAASGGYLIALAGDEIYADNSSIVGSIGVLFSGFGFVEAIGKLGVERRVYTAGEKKLSLDPFKPEEKDDIVRLKAIQSEIHEVFKDLVRDRRGDKIAGREDELFTGEFWAGQGALERGLIDGIADLRTLMRQRYGEKVKLRVIGRDKGWLARRLSRSSAPGFPDFGAGSARDLVDGALGAIEERALWSRFGL